MRKIPQYFYSRQRGAAMFVAIALLALAGLGVALSNGLQTVTSNHNAQLAATASGADLSPGDGDKEKIGIEKECTLGTRNKVDADADAEGSEISVEATEDAKKSECVVEWCDENDVCYQMAQSEAQALKSFCKADGETSCYSENIRDLFKSDEKVAGGFANHLKKELTENPKVFTQSIGDAFKNEREALEELQAQKYNYQEELKSLQRSADIGAGFGATGCDQNASRCSELQQKISDLEESIGLTQDDVDSLAAQSKSIDSENSSIDKTPDFNPADSFFDDGAGGYFSEPKDTFDYYDGGDGSVQPANLQEKKTTLLEDYEKAGEENPWYKSWFGVESDEQKRIRAELEKVQGEIDDVAEIDGRDLESYPAQQGELILSEPVSDKLPGLFEDQERLIKEHSEAAIRRTSAEVDASRESAEQQRIRVKLEEVQRQIDIELGKAGGAGTTGDTKPITSEESGFNTIPAVKVAGGAFGVLKDATGNLVAGGVGLVERTGSCALAFVTPEGYYENCWEEGPAQRGVNKFFFGKETGGSSQPATPSAAKTNPATPSTPTKLEPVPDQFERDFEDQTPEPDIAPSLSVRDSSDVEDEIQKPTIFSGKGEGDDGSVIGVGPIKPGAEPPAKKEKKETPCTGLGCGGGGGGGGGGSGLPDGLGGLSGLQDLLKGLLGSLGGGGGDKKPGGGGQQQPQQPKSAQEKQNDICKEKYPGTSVKDGRCTCPSGEVFTGGKCQAQKKEDEKKTTNNTELMAELSCAPKEQGIGAPILISFACRGPEGTTLRADGFDAKEKLSGSAEVKADIEKVDPLTKTQKFALTCIKDGKTETKSCEVRVNKSALVLVANPSSVNEGEQGKVGWISAGAKSCSVRAVGDSEEGYSEFGGDSIDSEEVKAFNNAHQSITQSNGTATTPPLTEDMVIVVKCKMYSGEDKEESVVVKVK